MNLLNQPYLDWAFCQPKKTGGGPPNLGISSQMTMKLGKGILWVEIFTNSQKVLMTPLSS